MRLLAIFAAIIFLGLTVWGVYYLTIGQARRQQTTLRRQASWQFRHYSQDGSTIVAVSKVVPGSDEVLDEHLIARFADDDPNWANLFLSGKLEAEERAFHLNSDGSFPQLPPNDDRH